MDIKDILSKVDHTLLNPKATWEEIKNICDDGMKYCTASVCIPPSFVKRAKEYVGENLKICTVIGLGYLIEKNYDNILSEITKIKAVCGKKILKVIIETCLLNEEQKIKMCEIVTKSGADFIKTSTGFSTGGATFEDIELFAKYVGKNIKIKAAGGISSIADAEKFISLGADRLGTSRIVKIVKSNWI